MNEALFTEELLGDNAPGPVDRSGPAIPTHSAVAVLDPSFADRVAALTRSRPIIDGLRTAASYQAWPDNCYDIATFALALIDLVISRQGFEDEVTPEEATAYIMALAAAAAPQRPPDEFAKAAQFTVDVLLNRAEHGRKFNYLISDYTPNGHVQRQVTFRLLQLKDDPARGVTVLNATADAINALVGGLEFDVADEQVANEAMLERQLARGAFAAAEMAAVKHRVLSIKLTEQIQSVLNDTRRDLRAVLQMWEVEMPARLDEARQHILDRLSIERRLAAKARESLESEDSTVRSAAARISNTLDDCFRRHQALLNKVIGARQVFFDEQDRQSFRAPSLGISVDMLEDVFDPFWALPSVLAQPLAEQLLVHITGPRPPRLPDLGRLVNELLDVRRPESPTEPTEIEEVDDREPQTVPAHVREASVAIATAVALPARTSTLIVACLTAETVLPDPADRLQAADLVALVALWCFAPSDSPNEDESSNTSQISVELATAMFGDQALSGADGTALVLPGWSGDDLIVAAHVDQFANPAAPVSTTTLPAGAPTRPTGPRARKVS
ncbi:hypothetical protein J2809_002574 [Arthrobacter pascens]|uniref:hypothetical protein n=1 Tax=Arthrobacter pascens TaxID=1677 RepID=UPI00285D4CA5|nr:hypothetical protein [Arthrobacter pascens]MDR6558204.1 hypothetical protein [Arthrobacter pascens]